MSPREAMSASTRTKLSQVREAQLAGEFVARCLRLGIPRPELQYHFAPPRRWSIDMAWPAQRIALEVEGGVWTGGRHTRGAGFIRDLEKYNTLALMGYRLFRTVPGQLTELPTLRLIGQALGVHVPATGEL